MRKPDMLKQAGNVDLQGTLALAKALIALPSITPDDRGCQLLIAERLTTLGFTIEHLRFGSVDNLWARIGTAAPLFVFAGHTDVVPTGPITEWDSPPFDPTERAGYLFGRGASDMKSSLAAMVTACERFLNQYPRFEGSIAFLITSDEEGPAKDGTQKVLETLQKRGTIIDYCLVGEPSSEEILGDVIKVGRRGSLSGHLKVFGQQKHIAYATAEDNPIHQSFAALSELASIVWDPEDVVSTEAGTGIETESSRIGSIRNSGAKSTEIGSTENENSRNNKNAQDMETLGFPTTSFQISNLHAGTHAGNVVPGILDCHFNFRFSPKLTPEIIQERVETILKSHQLRHEILWDLSGLPFLTSDGKLRQVASEAINELLGIQTEPSSMGGTSDARFIARTGAQVIEFGPSRKTIHGINECVKVDDIEKLSLVYERILQKLLGTT